jgi:hypothetical protein
MYPPALLCPPRMTQLSIHVTLGTSHRQSSVLMAALVKAHNRALLLRIQNRLDGLACSCTEQNASLHVGQLSTPRDRLLCDLK